MNKEPNLIEEELEDELQLDEDNEEEEINIPPGEVKRIFTDQGDSEIEEAQLQTVPNICILKYFMIQFVN